MVRYRVPKPTAELFSFRYYTQFNIDNMMIIKSPTAELPGDFSEVL